MMRRLMSLIAVISVVLFGVGVLASTHSATAQDAYEKGESVFTDATAELLAVGTVPSFPSSPAELALQRVVIVPGGHIDTPGNDGRVTLIYVERGTLTVRNTVDTVVTRGAAMGTPGAQAQEAIPAETEFTMSAGDANLSPASSGGELRNDGTEEVILLAGLIVPIPDGTAGTVGTPAS